ncbi:hypothetical protein AGMMS50230_20910 [Spirochaetia bacterium]|nr:hypothetical protein AGMMS50230_20910 [Spirochaetia bacterium]
MNKKYYFVVGFLFLFVSIIQATPDRYRYVIDNLIGLNGKNIIVHQLVWDNLQTYDGGIFEEYLIEKYMENGNTVIIKNIKITEQNKIENMLLKEYNGDINRIFPDMDYHYDYIKSIIDNGYIESGKEIVSRFYLKDHIPRELKNCEITRIVDMYFINEYIYLTLDLKDNTINFYRKIIMIKRW